MNIYRPHYCQHGPCPDCRELAIRRQKTFWHTMDTHQCDACGATFDDFDDKKAVINMHSRDEVWDGERADPPLHENAERKTKPLSWVVNSSKSIVKSINSVRKEAGDNGIDRKLTAGEKAKKNLSSVCFALGVLFCLTIIGIPIGVLFFVLAGILMPDVYNVETDDDDN